MNRGIITAIVIAGLIGGVVLLGTSGSSAKPPAHVDGPPGAGVDKPMPPANPQVLMPVRCVIECEDFDRKTIEDKTSVGRLIMDVHEETHGQVLKYLEIPDGELEKCGLGKADKVGGKFPGKASYNFEVPCDDTYYLYLRAKWFDDCGNSVYVKFDEGEWQSIEDNLGMITKTNYKWAWHPLTQEGSVKGIQLKKGPHVLWMNVREDGPKLDQWLVATDANTPLAEKTFSNK